MKPEKESNLSFFCSFAKNRYVFHSCLFLFIFFSVLISKSTISYLATENKYISSSVNEFNRKLLDSFSQDNQCIVIRNCSDVELNQASQESYCRNDAGFIDYLSFHYCTMSSVPAISIILMLFWLIFLFYLLVSTTEDYFSPSLAKISEKLKISNNIAGVTLLAFGNGSPDLFSAFVAIVHGSPGIAFGALIGAGVFVTTVVLGVISVISVVTVTRRPFFRDTLFYLFVAIITAIILGDGQVFLWESILFLVTYIIYLIGVITARYIYQKRKKQKRQQIGIVEDPDEFDEIMEKIDTESSFDDLLFITNLRSWRKDNRRVDNDENINSNEPLNFQSLLLKLNVSVKWQERNLREKILYIFLSPSILIRNLTIPVANEGEWNRIFAILNPIFVPQFLLFITKNYLFTIHSNSLNLPIYAILLFVGLIFSIFVMCTTKNEIPPRYFNLFVVFSFILSAVWLYVVSIEILCVLRTLGRIFHLSNEIIGLTTVAWGTSILDLVSNTVVARNGFPGMAISACFGSPTFNILIGGGIALTFSTIQIFPQPYLLNVTNSLIVAMAFLFASILCSIIVIPLCRFSSHKKYGIFLFCFYGIFAILTILTDFQIIFK